MNERFKDKYIFNSPYSPPKKKKMHTQELIGGIEILILQQVADSWSQVSDSGIGIDFQFPTILL